MNDSMIMMTYFEVQCMGYFFPARRPLVRVVCRVGIGVDVAWGEGGRPLDFVATVTVEGEEDNDNSMDGSGDGDRRGDLHDKTKNQRFTQIL